MEVNMIMEAFRFMVLGMGIVALFLIIMIQAIKLQAFLIGKYFPGQDTTSPPSVTTPQASSDQEEQARVAAVIAAVVDYRKNSQNN